MSRVRLDQTSPQLARQAALLLARGQQVPFADAVQLLSAPRVLPLELDEATAATLVAQLASMGVSASVIEVPPTRLRCAAHPVLTADGVCATCQAVVCPLCVDAAGVAQCAACATTARRKQKWQRIRLVPLVIVLLGALFVALNMSRERTRRSEWLEPLRVQLVLTSTAPLEPHVVESWQRGAEALNAWFAAEAKRHGLALENPMAFSLKEPRLASSLPVQPLGTDSALADARASVAFRERLLELAGADETFDLQLVVALRSVAPGARRLVEGSTERFGRIGLVEGNDSDDDITLELIATAHEALHAVGALDAYDANGHAVDPAGFVDAEPKFPQRYGEVMVGEVPDAPDRGHLPKSLDEVRIGPVTARQIGWVR